MSQNVFVYGTLMFPEILNALTGRQFKSEPAILKGYVRLSVAGEACPAIVSDSTSSVKGLLLRGVDDRSLQIIDEFEGEEYRQEKVRVLSIHDVEVEARVYIWGMDSMRLGDSWNSEAFRDIQLDGYLKRLKTKQENSV